MLQRNALSTIARAKDCHIPWTLEINRSNLSGCPFYLMETDCTLLVSYVNDSEGFECWVEEIKFTETRRQFDIATEKWTEREYTYVISEKRDGDLFDVLVRHAVNQKKLDDEIQDRIRTGEIAA